MNSATSIKDVPLAGSGTFRPWHFFLLLSLVAATAAVVATREATPEQLVLLSLAIGAAGLAAAGLYRTIAPLAAKDLSAYREPLTERSRAALEREKTLVLRSIKELEFDRAMGKISPKDFDEMAGRLRGRAVVLMKQLDEGGTGYREIVEREVAARLASGAGRAAIPATSIHQVSKRTCVCGTANDADAAFCKRCGGRLDQ